MRVTRSQVRRAREEEERTAAGPTVNARGEPAPKRPRRSAAVAKKTVPSKAVKAEEAESSKQEIVKLELEEKEADNTCSICFMSYSTIGEHRVVALKTCGHIFGKSCVEHWIRQSERAGNPHCPICKVTTAIREVLPLFVKSINSVSNDELDDLRAANQSLEEGNSQLSAANEDMEGRYEGMRHRATIAETAINQVRGELARKGHEINLLRVDLQTRDARVVELEALAKALSDELAVLKENYNKLKAAHEQSLGPVNNTSSAGGGEALGGNGGEEGGRRVARKK